MPVFQDESEYVLYCGTVVHGNYFRSEHHYFPGHSLTQLKDALNHLARLPVKETVFLARVDNRSYFLFQQSEAFSSDYPWKECADPAFDFFRKNVSSLHSVNIQRPLQNVSL